MKKSIFIMSMITLFSVISTQAKTPILDNLKPVKAIITQIYTMFGENTIPDEIRGHKAEIRLAIDRGNYLRILSIETENEVLEKYIRKSIDYEKLSNGIYKQGIIYRVPLEVRK